MLSIYGAFLPTIEVKSKAHGYYREDIMLRDGEPI